METNTTENRDPKQLLAEQQLKAEAAAAALQAKKEAAGDAHFVLNGRVFKPLIPFVELPKIGVRSALEICADKKAQAYLVDVPGNIGTVIEEVL